MKSYLCRAALAAAIILGVSSPTLAGGHIKWAVDSENSQVSFGSIKKGKVGEVHTFSELSGEVSEKGDAKIEIATSSLETNIDIRNERMMKWVFDAASPTISLAAKLDMDEVSALAVGGTTVVDVEGTLTLNGKAVDIEIEMFVARLADDKVLATSASMTMVSMADLGVDDGITKLMEVAKLPSISRASPVTIRIVFSRTKKHASNATDQGEKVVASATTSATPITGDVKLGKKVFKKCKACHEVKKAKNKVGPHLNGVIGREIGSVEGAKYSEALASKGGAWTVEAMTAFLKKPKEFAPGTSMAFPGLKKNTDIENVIAYMNSIEKK